jgi:hypothetical protein
VASSGAGALALLDAAVDDDCEDTEDSVYQKPGAQPFCFGWPAFLETHRSLRTSAKGLFARFDFHELVAKKLLILMTKRVTCCPWTITALLAHNTMTVGLFML